MTQPINHPRQQHALQLARTLSRTERAQMQTDSSSVCSFLAAASRGGLWLSGVVWEKKRKKINL